MLGLEVLEKETSKYECVHIPVHIKSFVHICR